MVATGTYTRYLVLDDGEHSVGFVHAKDVLHAIDTADGRDPSPTAETLAREIIVIPETRRIDEILAQFQAKGGQMAW